MLNNEDFNEWLFEGYRDGMLDAFSKEAYFQATFGVTVEDVSNALAAKADKARVILGDDPIALNFPAKQQELNEFQTELTKDAVRIASDRGVKRAKIALSMMLF